MPSVLQLSTLPPSVTGPPRQVERRAPGHEVKEKVVVLLMVVRMRSATIIKLEIVLGAPIAIDGTDVPAVGENPLNPPAVQQGAKSPRTKQQFLPALNYEFWSHYLPKIYEEDRSHSLLNQLLYGVKIGRTPASSCIISHNWPSAMEHGVQVEKIISEDLAAGRLFGPFDKPPYPACIVSPLGAFTKKGSSKVRLIHDLSYPSKSSVNSLIDSEEFSLSYASVDDAAALCRDLGPEPSYMAKLDLESAFKHVYINPDDWHLMGFTWPNEAGRPLYYFSKVLNFGLRSAPYLFDLFASALQAIMLFRGIPNRIIRYVDDFLVIAPTAELCQEYLDIMLQTCHDSGFAVQPSKVTSPSTVTEFLGIVIDTELQQLRISAARLRDLSAELDDWLGRSKATKRQILSIVGKLSFAAKVVRSGRAFISRLLSASKHAKALHHHVKLNREARLDLLWWKRCIASHNGISYYNPTWPQEGVVHVYSDASGLAMGATCGTEWWQISFTGSYAYMRDRSINWREFYAALVSLATWAKSIKGKFVIFHIDNMVVCNILNSLYSPVQDLMDFVRPWCLLVETYNLQVAVVYINTHDNVDADDLSRLRSQEFLQRNTSASRHMTWPTMDFMDGDL